MALGEIAKQLAEQAIRNQAEKAPAAPPAENPGATILAQLQAMQRALKEEDELVVLFLQTGSQTIRVHEIFLPSWSVAVLSGTDTEKNPVRAICTVSSLQLLCKVVKTQPPARPARVSLIAPRQ